MQVMANQSAELSRRQKAAAILLSVDSETAAAVLKNLSGEELTQVTREMRDLGDVEPEQAAAALQEFAERAGTGTYIVAGPAALRERLELAIGQDNARQVLIDVGLEKSCGAVFEPLQELGSEELYKLLVDEHPQTVAMVLSQLESKWAADALAFFPAESQVEIIQRMALTRQADEIILKKVGEIMRTKSDTLGEWKKTPDDPRYKKVADIINLLGEKAEEEIMKALSETSEEMAKKLREMMFVFEDLKNLSNEDMRKLLMSIDTQVLALALKKAPDELKDKIFANLSRRATETISEELELLGLKPLSQVNAAQQKVVDVARKMDAAGELNIRAAKFEEDPLV